MKVLGMLGRRAMLAPLVVVVFVSASLTRTDYQWSGFQVPEVSGNTLEAISEQLSGHERKPVYEQRFASSDLDEFVHSPSITALPDGGLMAAWFAGSREGAADVEIRTSRFDPATGWSDEEALVTREMTRQALGKPIRKLGNPVIALAPDQRLWLFYVSVSLGGWAGSAINSMVSEDFGQSWSEPQQLVTSPFINISTLVRAAPVFHQDGSIGLPVYHEFLGKFPEYLYLSADGRIQDKFRIADGTNSLQPTVVPLDEQRAIALLRYAGRRGHALAAVTEDGGRTWSEEQVIAPWNPNSSLAAVRSHRNTLLVAQNNLIDGRFRLSLDESTPSLSTWSLVMDLDSSPDPDGQPFAREDYEPLLATKFIASSGERRRSLVNKFMQQLDQRLCRDGACVFEYEYPYMINAGNGVFHLVYAWNNSFIKHVSFNTDWLEVQP
ncbi:sialidase family protein [Pseudomonas jilinensis]|nr:sialidase family protein [Pseudomonas jilinensis]